MRSHASSSVLRYNRLLWDGHKAKLLDEGDWIRVNELQRQVLEAPWLSSGRAAGLALCLALGGRAGAWFVELRNTAPPLSVNSALVLRVSVRPPNAARHSARRLARSVAARPHSECHAPVGLHHCFAVGV
jgi:hypothetical protein